MTLTTPHDWTAGERLTAGLMDTEIRNQFTDLMAPGVSYTPAWTSTGTAPVLGNGTLVGWYKLIGKTCTVTLRLTAGSTTTYGTGAYAFSLPFTASSNADWIGRAFVGDASVGAAGYSQATAFIGNGATGLNVYAGSVGASSQVGASSPQVFASGDRIWATCDFETI